MVLEVIQLQDGEGHVMMSDGLAVAEPGLDGTGTVGVLPTSSALIEPEMITGDTHASIEADALLHLHHQDKKTMTTQLKLEITDDEHKKDAQKEMETCFGFDVGFD